MMKHTNSDIPEVGEEFDDIQVIENTSNDLQEEDKKSKDSHELEEVKPMAKETNGGNQRAGGIDHETYYLSKQDERHDPPMTKATKYSKPILPKVLVALLIILVMAVIALAFVLYHLDQDLSTNKYKTNRLDGDLEEDRKKITLLESQIGNETLIRVEKDFKAYFRQLTSKSNKNNASILELRRNFKKDVDAIKQERNKSNTRILGLERAFSTEIPRLSKESKELNETLVQLDMFMEYKDHYAGKIGVTFKEVLKLAQKPNRVDKAIPHLVLLDYQYKQFTTKYQQKWGMNYSDVIRLTDRVDFELNKPIPLLQKIDCLYNIFEQQFHKVWKITFKDIIRLTSKEDIAAMTLEEWIELQKKEGIPLLLDKINYMYQEFVKNYQQKWGIAFKDVISLTDSLNFKINASSIPVLKKIDEWYFEGFEELWGDGFPRFLRVMTSSKGINRADILKKLQHINDTGKVIKFLPGIFEYKNETLYVYGYVGVYYNVSANLVGTIFNQFLQKSAVEVLCRSAGYLNGYYDEGKYAVGSMDRNSLKCLYNIIRCKGTEPNITKCPTVIPAIKDWKHDTQDAGIKCSF